jgi:hypothetical protein
VSKVEPASHYDVSQVKDLYESTTDGDPEDAEKAAAEALKAVLGIVPELVWNDKLGGNTASGIAQ